MKLPVSVGLMAAILLASLQAVAGQERKRKDAIADSVAILEAAEAKASDTAERVRLRRAILALKATTPFATIDAGKAEHLEDGSLRFTVERVTRDIGTNLWTVRIAVENKAKASSVPGEAWKRRLKGAKIADNTGSIFEAAGESSSSPSGRVVSKIDPGEFAYHDFSFLGKPGDKLSEFYLDLPRHHDKPDSVFVIPASLVNKKDK